MKHLFIIVGFLFSISTFGQSVGVGTTTPHPSAALDITSSDAGLLIPRVDTSMISTPAAGLMVFQPSNNGFYFYNGANWQKLGTVSEISDQDGDTHIQTEQTPDEDAIRLTAGGTETLIVRDGKLDMGSTVENVIIGHDAGLAQTGTFNVIIGEAAGQLNEASQNVMIGSSAGQNNTSGQGNTIVGDQAGRNNITGFSNTFIGKDAGFHNEEGVTNIAIGFTAGRQNVLGNNKLFIGNSAGYFHDQTGGGAVMVGHSAGLNNNSIGNTFLGNYANQFGNVSNSTVIGEYAARNSNSTQLIAIGNSAGYSSEGNNNIAIGFSSGANANGNNNIFIGKESGKTTNNSDNVFIGDLSGEYNTIGYHSVHIGSSTGRYDTSSRNNVYIGYEAGIGGYNTSFFHSKEDNVLIGNKAGFINTENDNTMIGTSAGEFSNGAGNIFIGKNAGSSSSGGNKLYIDNTDTSEPLIYGNMADDSLIINGALNIQNEYTFPSNDGLPDQVMATNGNGNIYWTSLGDDGDWTELSTGFYNNTDRFAIGTNSIFSSRKFTVESNTESTTGYFRNNSSASTSYGLAGYNYGTGTTNKYGVYGWAANTGTGNRVGVFGGGWGSASSSGYGGYFQGYGTNSIGVYGQGDKLAAHFEGIVGIGTATGFDSQVHIHKASSNVLPSKIRFTDNITGLGSTTIDAGFEIGLGSSQQGVILHHSSENLEFYLNTTKNVLTLEPDGDIKMGLSGEVDQVQLNQGSMQLYNLGASNDDNGYKWAENTANVFGFVYDGAGSSSENRLHLREYIGTTSDVMTIKADGRIGIRNTVPGFDLHMGSNSAAKPASSAWSVTSDARSKDVLGDFEDGLETLLQIDPVHYKYNGTYNLPAGLEAIGTVAQDLKKVAPYMVNTSIFEHEDGQTEEYYTVDYGAMDFVLINAIKDLKEIIDLQQKKIEALENKLKQ